MGDLWSFFPKIMHNFIAIKNRKRAKTAQETQICHHIANKAIKRRPRLLMKTLPWLKGDLGD